MDNQLARKMALNNLNIFHIKCTRGIYNDRLFRFVLNNVGNYTKEDIEWMREFVNSSNELIGTGCLEILCSAGASTTEFASYVSGNLEKKQWCYKFIELAEKQNDPDSLLFFLEEDGIYLNRAILALKRNKQESYLTTLMFSDNDDFTKAVTRIVDNEK